MLGMNYLLLKQGSVVNVDGVIIEDVLVGGNKILQMGKDLCRPTSDTPVIDASGKFILPGCVDFNRNFLQVIGGSNAEDDIEKLNQALIYNGTTVIIDAIEDIYQKNYLYNINKAKEKAKNNVIDYAFHLSFAKAKDISIQAIDYSYIHEGVSSILLPIADLHGVSEEILQLLLSGILDNNLVLLCDLSLSDSKKCRINNESLDTPQSIKLHLKTLKKIVEIGVTYGCTILFLNVSYQEELGLIHDGIEREANFYVSLAMPYNIELTQKTRGIDDTKVSSAEQSHHLKLLQEIQIWNLIQQGRYIVNTPPINLNASVDYQGQLVYNRPDAYYYIRNFLSMIYTLGVENNKMSISQMVDITSTTPAHLLGLYPQKGVIMPGADADIVVWNPEYNRNLYCSLPFVDSTNKKHKLKGRPDFVFLRGRMVYNGELFDTSLVNSRFVFRSSFDSIEL